MTLFIILFVVSSTMAHPPKSITLKFDNKTQELDVKITHPVKDVKDHFIETILIKVNDSEVVKQVYKFQRDEKADVFRFKLEDLKSGDVIQLKANCSKWGKKNKSLTLE